MRTLFYNPEMLVYDFQQRYQVIMSLEFATCADQQLTPLFEQQTGLKINKEISVTTVNEWTYYLHVGSTSKFPLFIYVNHNWNPVVVTWRSHSGRIYKLEDTDIDCSDIIFGFEGLDAALYHRQLYPGYQFPFRLKNISYELVVTRLNIDCSMALQLKEECLHRAEEITKHVDTYLASFNEKSERNKRRYGLVHNWNYAVEGSTITFDLDLGSAGPTLFKALLPWLSDLNCVEKVVID